MQLKITREMLDEIFHTDFPIEESHIIILLILGEVPLKSYRIGINFVILSVLFAPKFKELL